MILSTDTDSVTREQAQAVIDAVLAYIAQSGISRREIAQDIGIAASTLGQVLNWKYTGVWQEIVADLDKWLENRQKQDAAPKNSQFVWTSVALEIRTVADVAMTLKRIGLVYGPSSSGMGKTMTLEAIAAETPGSILATVEKVNAGKAGLLKAIARALKIGDGQSAYLYQRIKTHLQGSSRLLMIDQIHNLCNQRNHEALFVLCDLWDATKSPQLWCGTSDIVTYLDQRQKKGAESLTQIKRRIAISRDLLERTREGEDGPGEPAYTIDQVRKIFARCAMRLDPGAVQYLHKLSCEEDMGAIGLATTVVNLAVASYQRSAQVLTRDMIRATLKLLISPKRFRCFENQLEDRAARPIARVG